LVDPVVEFEDPLGAAADVSGGGKVLVTDEPELGGKRISTAKRIPGGASTAGSGKANDVVSGRSQNRQRATLTSATGQLHGRLRAASRGRCPLSA
jgi:hypothetical protein